HPFKTDSGNLIADCAAESIPDPERLARMLEAIPGVVDHGLFLSMASAALIGTPGGVRVIEPPRH
ncbi:MAG: ribose-5-phosphate isomerase A, partial [Micropepsaceae bacterium]